MGLRGVVSAAPPALPPRRVWGRTLRHFKHDIDSMRVLVYRILTSSIPLVFRPGCREVSSRYLVLRELKTRPHYWPFGSPL